ncbi:hypothetical protein B484DRAFT_180042 [Ochromonadaceae sp. CCMP2298]|nr:hypothetical protein B484DRAFT_180042 [Ochromonadaceae sp. CCMP2298]
MGSTAAGTRCRGRGMGSTAVGRMSTGAGTDEYRGRDDEEWVEPGYGDRGLGASTHRDDDMHSGLLSSLRENSLEFTMPRFTGQEGSLDLYLGGQAGVGALGALGGARSTGSHSLSSPMTSVNGMGMGGAGMGIGALGGEDLAASMGFDSYFGALLPAEPLSLPPAQLPTSVGSTPAGRSVATSAHGSVSSSTSASPLAPPSPSIAASPVRLALDPQLGDLQ